MIGELRNRFGRMPLLFRRLAPGFPLCGSSVTITGSWRFLKETAETLRHAVDLHGMDERLRTHREGLPAAVFPFSTI